MQPLAEWLVARPQNGVLVLAGTMLLPMGPLLSGIVAAVLALHYGPKIAPAQVAIAAGLLALVTVLISLPVTTVVMNAVSTWLPALILALLVRHWRSLTLSLQVSAILAVAVTIGYFVVLGDPTDYWNGVVQQLIATFREAGFTEQANLLEARQPAIVPQMTMLSVFLSWSVYTLVVLLGYWLFQNLPGKGGVFGRFRDLNFGRVLALILAVASVFALFTGAAWLQNAALVVFAIFWIQGLALLHWLKAQGRLPAFVLIMAYAFLPVLNVLLIMGFAVVGYTDAWFNYRARVRAQDAE